MLLTWLLGMWEPQGSSETSFLSSAPDHVELPGLDHWYLSRDVAEEQKGQVARASPTRAHWQVSTSPKAEGS